LPNVPIDSAKVPQICTGDTLHDNPFGYLAVVGTNGVLHFQVEYDGAVDHAWLDITEANVAYLEGQTEVAVFERQLSLGGPIQYCAPADLTELSAEDWDAWADGSTPESTYVQDDPDVGLFGETSLHFVTDGGFDTYVRYPRSFTARWDLGSAETLSISAYAENPNIGFQSGSPWIRLKDAQNNYFEYQYFQGGEPFDLLNLAQSNWQTYEIPLDASSTTENGWRRTPVGSPDLSQIQYLEIHADTWDSGFDLWLDGVGFEYPSQADEDQDRVHDLCDNCPKVSNPGQTDTDINGIGDACQCGDVSIDGHTNFIDGRLVLLGEVPPGPHGRCDVNGDGTCNFTDARLILLGQVGSAHEDQLCPAYQGQ
jgi:hypothetical protein